MKDHRITTWQIYTLGGLACVIVTLCAWYLLAGPAFEVREQEHDLQLQALDRHRQMPKLTAQLTITRKQSEAIHQQIDTTHVTLVPTSSLNERLAQIESIASQNGVAVDEVKPGDVAPGSHFQTLPIRLVGSASYPNCAGFVHYLHETLPDVSVKSLEISGASAANKSGAGTFHFELIWYARK